MAQNGQTQTIDKGELIGHLRRIAGTFPQESQDGDLLKLAGLVIERDAQTLAQQLHIITDADHLKRGHFAAMILSGLLSDPNFEDGQATAAVAAVKYADTLLAELDKPT